MLAIDWELAVKLMSSGPFGAALNVAAFIAGMMGLIVALVAWRRKRPYYRQKSLAIVRDFNKMFDTLQIIRDGEPVENITITKIAFWNAGRDTIKDDDVATKDPISIVLGEGLKILEDPKLRGNLDPANNIRVSPSTDLTKVNCKFEYLSKHEGFVVEIVHNGLSKSDVTLQGTIKGHKISDVERLGLPFFVTWVCLFFVTFSCLYQISASFELERKKVAHKYKLQRLNNEMSHAASMMRLSEGRVKFLRWLWDDTTGKPWGQHYREKYGVDKGIREAEEAIKQYQHEQQILHEQIEEINRLEPISVTVKEILSESPGGMAFILFFSIISGFFGGLILQWVLKARLPASLSAAY